MKLLIILTSYLIFLIGPLYSQGGMGSDLLPGNYVCDDQYISVSPCNGVTSITYNSHTYDLVEIGGQCWFAENLQTTTYRNGNSINNLISDSTWIIDTAGAYSWYNNDSTTYAETYGALYNLFAVRDTSGLCPSGWHVASDCEWMYLEDTLGMSISQQTMTLNRGTNEGGKLKEAGTILWDSPNTGATNSSGFTAFPGGWRSGYDGNFQHLNTTGSWWSPDSNIYSRYYRAVYNSMSKVARKNFLGFGDEETGLSVRCIKDSNAIQTSIKKTKLSVDLNIYPNPFSTSTTIAFANPKQKNYQLNVYDVLGNKVHVINNITSNRVELKRENLISGIYFIELHFGNERIRGNVLIE